ncbi:SsrA-binding protein SmpB [Stomatohabitans albus]|uniref:SsrA-binding protein SmpB n=1 Tax=Stomatohabitans albus TaxID=3110766 RepID=UPI00300D2B00
MGKGTKHKNSSNDITVNRRARHEYQISETVECGIMLRGTEVKSLRAGHGSLNHAFAAVRDDELWLYGAEIAEYAQGNRWNHDTQRRRKLLANRREIQDMARFTQERGRTLVPLKMYWKDGRAKVLIGYGVGKSEYDKRQSAKEATAKREMARAMSDARRS